MLFCCVVVSLLFRFDLRSKLIMSYWCLLCALSSLMFTTNESHLHLIDTAHFLLYLNPLQQLFRVGTAV